MGIWEAAAPKGPASLIYFWTKPRNSIVEPLFVLTVLMEKSDREGQKLEVVDMKTLSSSFEDKVV